MLATVIDTMTTAAAGDQKVKAPNSMETVSLADRKTLVIASVRENGCRIISQSVTLCIAQVVLTGCGSLHRTDGNVCHRGSERLECHLSLHLQH